MSHHWRMSLHLVVNADTNHHQSTILSIINYSLSLTIIIPTIVILTIYQPFSDHQNINQAYLIINHPYPFMNISHLATIMGNSPWINHYQRWSRVGFRFSPGHHGRSPNQNAGASRRGGSFDVQESQAPRACKGGAFKKCLGEPWRMVNRWLGMSSG